MPQHQDKISTLLLLVGLLSVVTGLFPQGGWHTDPATDEVVTQWTLGFTFSPLWKYTKRQSSDGSFKSTSGLQFLSWSWIPIAIGAICLELLSRRRRKQRRESAITDEEA